MGVRVDIDKDYILIQGQGHWVKGQGQQNNSFYYFCKIIYAPVHFKFSAFAIL